MGWFSRKTDRTDKRPKGGKPSKEQQEMDRLLAKLDGRLVKYVVRRTVNAAGSPEEIVLGKEGRIMAPGGFVAVSCGDRDVFRSEAGRVQCSELMSLEGAVLSGFNTILGQEDTVVAYYKYYR